MQLKVMCDLEAIPAWGYGANRRQRSPKKTSLECRGALRSPGGFPKFRPTED